MVEVIEGSYSKDYIIDKLKGWQLTCFAVCRCHAVQGKQQAVCTMASLPRLKKTHMPSSEMHWRYATLILVFSQRIRSVQLFNEQNEVLLIQTETSDGELALFCDVDVENPKIWLITDTCGYASWKGTSYSLLNVLSYETTERKIGGIAVQGRNVEEVVFNNFLCFILSMRDSVWPS